MGVFLVKYVASPGLSPARSLVLRASTTVQPLPPLPERGGNRTLSGDGSKVPSVEG